MGKLHQFQQPFPPIDMDRLVDAARLCYPKVGTKDQSRNQVGSIKILGKKTAKGSSIKVGKKKKAQGSLEGTIKKKENSKKPEFTT